MKEPGDEGAARADGDEPLRGCGSCPPRGPDETSQSRRDEGQEAEAPEQAELGDRLEDEAVGLAHVLVGAPLPEVVALVVARAHALQRGVAELVERDPPIVVLVGAAAEQRGRGRAAWREVDEVLVLVRHPVGDPPGGDARDRRGRPPRARRARRATLVRRCAPPRVSAR